MSPITINSSSCLGRTCMKWGIDGELSALDLDLVMERLAQVPPLPTKLSPLLIESLGA